MNYTLDRKNLDGVESELDPELERGQRVTDPSLEEPVTSLAHSTRMTVQLSVQIDN